MPYVIGVSGYKNSGKTTLCAGLVDLLTRESLSVGYLKHTHETVLPRGGNDTSRLAEVTSDTVIWGSDGFAGFHPDETVDLRDILSVAFPGRDIVIVEGGKHLVMPKIWVGELKEEDGIHGVVARFNPPEVLEEMPCFFTGDEGYLAEFVTGLWRKARKGPVELYSDNRNIPVKAFVGEFIAGGIRGMLSALKKPPSLDEDLRIYVKPQNGADES
ncbi:MAG: molybdopterin-guanine dinucleotide biosynthesis protein B [Thermovirgaceae bacterium]